MLIHMHMHMHVLHTSAHGHEHNHTQTQASPQQHWHAHMCCECYAPTFHAHPHKYECVCRNCGLHAIFCEGFLDLVVGATPRTVIQSRFRLWLRSGPGASSCNFWRCERITNCDCLLCGPTRETPCWSSCEGPHGK